MTPLVYRAIATAAIVASTALALAGCATDKAAETTPSPESPYWICFENHTCVWSRSTKDTSQGTAAGFVKLYDEVLYVNADCRLGTVSLTKTRTAEEAFFGADKGVPLALWSTFCKEH